MHFFYKFTIENKKSNKKFLDLDNFFSLASSTTTPPTPRSRPRPRHRPGHRKRPRPKQRPRMRIRPRHRPWISGFSHTFHRPLLDQDIDQISNLNLEKDEELDQDLDHHPDPNLK